MSAHASKNCLTELNTFSANLRDAFDLYDDVQSLFLYSFGGSRALVDVVKTACSDEDNVKECNIALVSLATFVSSDIVTLSSRLAANGLPRSEFKDYTERLSLFFEIGRTLGVPEISENAELNKCVDETMAAVAQAYTKEKQSLCWSTLKPLVFSYFTRSSPLVCEVELIADSYAREDGIVSGAAFERALLEKKDARTKLLTLFKEVVDRAQSKRPCAMLVQAFVSEPLDIFIDDDSTFVGFLRLIDCFDVVYKGSDFEFKYLFTELLEKSFGFLSARLKEKFARCLYEKYVTSDANCFPDLRVFTRNFQRHLTETINQLGDHNDIVENRERFEATKNKLVFFLLVMPVVTVQQILIQCVENKGIVPAVVKTFRSASSLFNLTALVTEMAELEAEPILTCTLRKLFIKEKTRWESSDQLQNFCYVALSLTKKKKIAIKDRIFKAGEINEEKALLDPVNLINYVLLPTLLESSPREQEAILNMLSRLFGGQTGKDNVFQWSTNINDTDCKEEKKVPIVPLLALIHDLLVGNEGLVNNISSQCRELIKHISGRLTESGVIFDSDVCKFLLYSWNRDVWWLKFCLCSWLHTSLGQPKLEVPSGLYAAMPLDQQENHAQIATTSAASSANCFLRCLIELALFDSDLAILQLRKGFDARLLEENLLEKIALVLVDCCGRPFSSLRVAGVTDFLAQLIKMLDPPREFKGMAKLSVATFEGFRMIEPLLLLALATKMAFKKCSSAVQDATFATTENSFENPQNHEKVALTLLDAFCEACNTHIDKEIDSVNEKRETVFKSQKVKSDDYLNQRRELEKREASILYELSTLFNESCLLTRLVNVPPHKLQLLLFGIAEKIKNLPFAVCKKLLDIKITETVKENTKYIYLQSTEAPQEVAPPPQQKAAELLHSAENRLFDQPAQSQRTPLKQSDLSGMGPSTSTGSQRQWKDPQTLSPMQRDRLYSHVNNHSDFMPSSKPAPQRKLEGSKSLRRGGRRESAGVRDGGGNRGRGNDGRFPRDEQNKNGRRQRRTSRSPERNSHMDRNTRAASPRRQSRYDDGAPSYQDSYDEDYGPPRFDDEQYNRNCNGNAIIDDNWSAPQREILTDIRRNEWRSSNNNCHCRNSQCNGGPSDGNQYLPQQAEMNYVAMQIPNQNFRNQVQKRFTGSNDVRGFIGGSNGSDNCSRNFSDDGERSSWNPRRPIGGNRTSQVRSRPRDYD